MDEVKTAMKYTALPGGTIYHFVAMLYSEKLLRSSYATIFGKYF